MRWILSILLLVIITSFTEPEEIEVTAPVQKIIDDGNLQTQINRSERKRSKSEAERTKAFIELTKE